MNAPFEIIIATVATVTGVPVAAITGRRRNRRVAWSRFLSIAAMRMENDWWTLQEYGDAFRLDHSAIIHASRRHLELIQTEAAYARMWAQVCQDLGDLIMDPQPT